MKTPRLILAMLLLFAASAVNAATVTGRSAKTTPAGTEKIPIDDAGTDKYITIGNLFVGSPALTTPTITTPVIATGLTASGSAANDFSGSTGNFLTSTGVNSFGGSSHTFSSVLRPLTDDAASLGAATYGFSDLFLASGGVINWNNGNVVLTHSAGVITLGTGNLIITTAGTATGSVVTNNGTQTLASKTLTSPVIATGLTASGSAANDFSGSTGAFKTSTGAATFGGSAHNFSAVLQPTTNDAAALGTTTLGFSDLFLATGGTLHFGNTNWVATHTSGILTVGTGDLRVTTAGTNAASVVTVGGTQTLTAKTLTSPVIGTGLTASGSASNDFSGSTGTFKTSTGVNTFGGSGHTFASGITPVSSDGGALGSSTLMWSDLFLASGGVININNGNWVATHTSGILTVGTGDLRVTTAGTNAASAVTVGGTQTLTNKTLTSPVIGTGLTASGSASNNFGGSTGAFVTSSGANTLSGAVAASSTFTQTSASATAFESGPNGGTNPVFRLVNNVSSAATGLSITGRAAAAGTDIVVLSSGTNEDLRINAKGSGTITLNGTATGAVTVNKLKYTELTEVVAATNVITASESGSTFFLNHATEFVSTLPAPAAGLRFTFIVTAAPSGASYTIVTNASGNVIIGNQVSMAGDAGDTGTADDTITFVDGQAVAGDRVEVWCDGTNWFAIMHTKIAAGGTFTQAN